MRLNRQDFLRDRGHSTSGVADKERSTSEVQADRANRHSGGGSQRNLDGLESLEGGDDLTILDGNILDES